jgi:hypothetical protein
MKSSNRDLLVLAKSATTNKIDMDREVEKLHYMLFRAESIENFCIANEIIDVNKYKVIDNPARMQKMLCKSLKPFQFINNKN